MQEIWTNQSMNIWLRNPLIECSNTMDDAYDNIDYYNSSRRRKILIGFDDMIADIMSNKKFQAIRKELFIRCRKLNISHVFIPQSYLFVPRDVRLNSMNYLIMKINNKRVLQNIAINHSADIDYKDFIRIYRECTKEAFNFLTIDTTLPSSDSLRFRKNLFDQIKILNRKIMKNEAQYDLDRKAAKISVLSSNNLGKYEYSNGEDLVLKPSTTEQTKFEYSTLVKIFGLDKDEDKKEGLLKRLKNINKEQLKAIEDHGKNNWIQIKNYLSQSVISIN